MPSSKRARSAPARSETARFGKPRLPRQTEPPVPRLAIGNATASSQASAKPPTKSNSRSCPSASPLVLVQKTAQLIQLFLGRPPALQRMDQQLACRALKHPLEDVPDELPLCFRRRLACLVNVGPLLLVSADSALGGHDLQKFENCGIAERLLFSKFLVDLPDRGRPARPKDAKNLKFGNRGLLEGFLIHAQRVLRRVSYCQRKSSYSLGHPPPAACEERPTL